MAELLTDFDQAETSPLDMMEALVSAQDWPFERMGDDEIEATISGRWTDYHLSLTWREDLEALHLACGFESRIAPVRMSEVHALLVAINEQLWLGHFDLWAEENMVLYRYGLSLQGTSGASPEQCARMLFEAVDACERFYPAFQFVLWAGRTARDALAASMFETEGEA